MDSHVNNFSDALKNHFLEHRKLNQNVLNKLKDLNLIEYKKDKIIFFMKDLDDNIIGKQERYKDPIIFHGKEIKSKTEF